MTGQCADQPITYEPFPGQDEDNEDKDKWMGWKRMKEESNQSPMKNDSAPAESTSNPSWPLTIWKSYSTTSYLVFVLSHVNPAPQVPKVWVIPGHRPLDGTTVPRALIVHNDGGFSIQLVRPKQSATVHLDHR
ncbi:uncharacterized protein BO96DRAFT_436769 [Aspergillus niger CBS 101883]|uniref:uncharacterized protein n=1 Tax=Aspergillus lacticoffeatus (strain CBS 101883) TaxID=1450533 RepID=UPI000D8019E7|nr:uncharacterized protein BO96DRAFT_436769 [Aspergillus niger CBS 101883]PYH53863.1 hypothetical protein BO96DRAFT_436769 [Aspergillus niger CBS 101883]